MREAAPGVNVFAVLARLGKVATVIVAEWLRSLYTREGPYDMVRRIVVRVGPTATKLAQIASTRPDLVGAELAGRLSDLQEHAPPFEHRDAVRVIEEDLGKRVGQLFPSLSPEPIAAASLSQVYFGRLPDGCPVAIKVQRPAIARLVQLDVIVLRWLARFATLLRPRLRNLRLASAADEFGRWTLRELDFRIEGENLDEMRRNFEGVRTIRFPKVHWTYTSSRVLTMERVAGARVQEVATRLSPPRRTVLARLLADALFKMFVVDGFFHADLHPGNVFFEDDGSIVLLDLGMVGRMTTNHRERFLAYWVAVARRQHDRAFYHLMKLGNPVPRADLEAYRRRYEDCLRQFDNTTLAERSLAQTYLEIVSDGARFGVVFPVEMLLQAKALVTMESMCLTLAPDFRFTSEIRPFVARSLASYVSPPRIADHLWSLLPDYLILGEQLTFDYGIGSATEDAGFRADAVSAIARALSDFADERLIRLRSMNPSPASAKYWTQRPEMLSWMRATAKVIDWARRGSTAGTPPAAVQPIVAREDAGRVRWRTFQQDLRAAPDASLATVTAGLSSSHWQTHPQHRALVHLGHALVRIWSGQLEAAARARVQVNCDP